MSAQKAFPFSADSDFAEPAKSPVDEQDETEPEETSASATNEGAEASSDFSEPEKSTEEAPEEQTVAEEIAEKAEEGLTVEAEANTLPINEDGRREIHDEYNDTAIIQDESNTTDPSLQLHQ